jgi:hypothetical protein
MGHRYLRILSLVSILDLREKAGINYRRALSYRLGISGKQNTKK